MGFFGGGGSAASNMVGATSSTAGTAGLVPAPEQRNQFTCLAGDATFKPALIRPNIASFETDRNYGPVASRSSNGLVTFPNFSSTAYTCPIFLKAGTIDSLAVALGAQVANSTNYVALYDSDSNGKPSTLLTSSTANSFTTTQTTDDNKIKVVTLSSSLAVNAGLYYAALFGSNSSNQFRGIISGDDSMYQFFMGVRINSTPSLVFTNLTFTIAISSSTFPSSASPSITAQASPAIYVHYSS